MTVVEDLRHDYTPIYLNLVDLYSTGNSLAHGFAKDQTVVPSHLFNILALQFLLLSKRAYHTSIYELLDHSTS